MLPRTEASLDCAPARPLARVPLPAWPFGTPAETIRLRPCPPRLVLTLVSIGDGEPMLERKPEMVLGREGPDEGEGGRAFPTELRLESEGDTGRVDVLRGGFTGRPLGGTEVGRATAAPLSGDDARGVADDGVGRDEGVMGKGDPGPDRGRIEMGGRIECWRKARPWEESKMDACGSFR